MSNPQVTYEELVSQAQEECPTVGIILSRAQENRRERLATYCRGHRLKGLNELLEYLASAATTFQSHRDLAGITFLVQRMSGDLETALEGTLSGLPAPVGDAMRDMMELELLLDDFRHDPSRIQAWLTADCKTRIKQFSPVQLKDRYAQRMGKDPKNLGITACYAAHSEILHVTPTPSLLGGRGVQAMQHPFQVDLCFGELFEHARRAIYPLYHLMREVLPTTPNMMDPAVGLPAAEWAWFSTQAVCGFVFGMMDAQLPNGEEAPSSVLLNTPAKFAFDATVRIRDNTHDDAFAGECIDPARRGEMYKAVVPMAAELTKLLMRWWLPPAA